MTWAWVLCGVVPQLHAAEEAAPAPQQQNAESAANASAGNVGSLEEVLVTARRREENVMRVPDTVSVFTSAQIDNLRLNEIGQFAQLTPNVKIAEEQDAATNEIYIRGIGSNRNEASAVAFVVDGVVLPDPDAFTTDLSDADHVEILKGPQGALYGKGALAGAIVINTRQPGNELAADTKLSYGSGDSYDAFAAIGGPVIPDTVLARLTVKYQHSNGNYTNAFNAQPLEPNNFVKPALTLRIKPSEALTFDIRGSFYKQEAGNPPYTLTNIIGPPGNGTGGIINSSIADTSIAHNDPDRSTRRIYDGSLTAAYETRFGTLTSITAYDKIAFTMKQDLDFTPLQTALAFQDRDTRGTSEEIRFTSPSDQALRYIVGAYYQYTKRFVKTDALLDVCLLGLGGSCGQLPQIPSGILLPLQLAKNDNYDHQYAGFAQVNYDLLQNLELTAALRYDQDNRSQSDSLLQRVDAATFHAVQPKLSLSYRLTPETMIYGTYAQGYKSGIFNTYNTVIGNIPLVVQPEKTNGFEVGTKEALFSRHLLLTAAAFYTSYQNAQEYHLDIQSGGQATVNVNKARILGVEAQAQAQLSKNLELDVDFGYTGSRIQDFNGTSAYVGQRLPSTPLYTLNIGPQYTHALPTGHVSARMDFAQFGRTLYQDFQNPNSNEVLTQLAYHTVNAQVAYGYKNWTLTVFGKNVFNEHYVNTAYSRYISQLIFGVTGDLIQPAVGATYGVEIRATFQ